MAERIAFPNIAGGNGKTNYPCPQFVRILQKLPKCHPIRLKQIQLLYIEYQINIYYFRLRRILKVLTFQTRLRVLKMPVNQLINRHFNFNRV